jgi:tetratricopeptide (TPR) repeat protein
VTRRAALPLIALAALLSGCFGGPPSVTRYVGGQTLPDRYISPEAYASYAQGALLEANGQPQSALGAYERALGDDPDSTELWTRVASLQCRLHASSADASFARARDLDPDYAPLWREQARCALDRHHPRLAARDAERSLVLDPDDLESSLLYARICEATRQISEEGRWLDALVTRRPRSVAAWKALLAFAEHHGDAARVRRAAEALRVAAPELLPQLERVDPELALPARIDRALRAGRLKEARSLALSAHLAPGELALRAAEIGRADLARREATRVLEADPSNGNAWVAELIAADLSGDAGAFARALDAPSARLDGLSPLGATLWAELLRRRVGEHAAESWLRAYPPHRTDKPQVGSRANGSAPDRVNAWPKTPPASGPRQAPRDMGWRGSPSSSAPL